MQHSHGEGQTFEQLLELTLPVYVDILCLHRSSAFMCFEICLLYTQRNRPLLKIKSLVTLMMVTEELSYFHGRPHQITEAFGSSMWTLQFVQLYKTKSSVLAKGLASLSLVVKEHMLQYIMIHSSSDSLKCINSRILSCWPCFNYCQAKWNVQGLEYCATACYLHTSYKRYLYIYEPIFCS